MTRLLEAFDEVTQFRSDVDEAVSMLTGASSDEHEQLVDVARPMLLGLMVHSFMAVGLDKPLLEACEDPQFESALGSALVAAMDMGVFVGALVARERGVEGAP